MDASNLHQNTLRLEAIVASDLNALLEKISVGSTFSIEASKPLFSSLEYYIPLLLSRYYPEWQSESLDGILPAKVQKIDAKTAEFAGLCILMSDQTVTPVFIRLTLSELQDSISSYRVFLGERGGGRLGISADFSKSQMLLMTLTARLENIQWSYKIGNEL